MTIEHAEAINNELYQKFSILNNSVPIITDLNSKKVSQLDLLLSRTYSDDIELATKVAKEVIGKHGNNYPIFNDVFAVISLGIAKGDDYPVAPYQAHITVGKTAMEAVMDAMFTGKAVATFLIERNEPLRIIYANNRTGFEEILKETSGGIYKSEYNVVLSMGGAKEAVHEDTHASMNLLFNNIVNPYFKGAEAAYHVATKTFLLNLNSKLGKSNEDILDLEASDLYSYIQSYSIIDLMALSKATALDIKSFFSTKSLFSGNMFLNENRLEQWKDEYFPNDEVEEITLEKIREKILKEAAKLNLTMLEVEVIARISNLFTTYDKGLFDAELITKMVELYYDYGNEVECREFFAPIEQYWVEYIHPMVENDLIIPHQLECNGTTNDNIFVHCVEEYMA